MDAGLELTLGDAALLVAEGLLVMGALETMSIGDRDDCGALPRGVLTCGEAWRLIPTAVALLLEKFPQLADPDVFDSAVNTAKLNSAAGAIN